MKKILVACACVALASCTTTPDQQAAAAKAYDQICTTEPSLYAAYVTVALAKGKDTTKVDAIHSGIVDLCQARPTDIVTGLPILAAAYARFITATAK